MLALKAVSFESCDERSSINYLLHLLFEQVVDTGGAELALTLPGSVISVTALLNTFGIGTR